MHLFRAGRSGAWSKVPGLQSWHRSSPRRGMSLSTWEMPEWKKKIHPFQLFWSLPSFLLTLLPRSLGRGFTLHQSLSNYRSELLTNFLRSASSSFHCKNNEPKSREVHGRRGAGQPVLWDCRQAAASTAGLGPGTELQAGSPQGKSNAASLALFHKKRSTEKMRITFPCASTLRSQRSNPSV